MTTKTTVISLREVAYCTGTSCEMITKILDEGLIEPVAVEDDEFLFLPDVLRHVRRILRLHDHLQVNIEAMALVLELIENKNNESDGASHELNKSENQNSRR